ncbi:uncharacterized protein [Mobula birostris]|uniref:uncharacterized protein isoform X3 n=1 Tax=Mobula birostris TaxID=1983395 RepID=UPI003B286B3C
MERRKSPPVTGNPGFVWLVLSLSLSVTIGHRCPNSLQHVVAAVQDTSLIKSFPKDYKVRVHVTSNDLNATACAYTVLALLKGDWQALKENVWEGQQNWKLIEWILKGLDDLNLKEKNETCTWQEPVSKLISVTLQALDLLKRSHCTPCNNWAGRWCRRDRAATGNDVHRVPLATPLLSDDRAGVKIDIEGSTGSPRPRRTGPSCRTPGSEEDEENSISQNPSLTPTSHSGNSTICNLAHGCLFGAPRRQPFCRKLFQQWRVLAQELRRLRQGRKGQLVARLVLRGRE